MKFLPILILAVSVSCVLCIRIKKQSIGGGTSVNDGPGIGSGAGNGDGPHVYGGGCNLSNGGIGKCFYCPGCPGSAGSFDGCPDSYICGGSSGQYPPPNQGCNDDSRCVNWVRNGFCSSTFYTRKQKRQYCPNSCNLCYNG